MSDGPWVSKVSVLGDTTVVQTVSGSVREASARLVEELRLGELEGDGHESFGTIEEAAVAPDGTIFLFDSQVPQILRFAASGEFLSTIGREGEGPGEYSSRITGMIVHQDRLLIADPRNARLAAFSLNGEYQGSLGSVTGLRSLYARELTPWQDGGFVLRVLTVDARPGQLPTPWPIGLEVRQADGTVRDTIQPQTILGERGRAPEALPWGGLLVDSESGYLFDLRHEDGGVVRVQMPFARVEFTEGELRMLGRALAPVAVADGEAHVALPELKAPYLEYLFSDQLVWARRPIRDTDEQATWRWPLYQPSVLDVFGRDGRYLGVVPLPPASRPVVVTDTHLYVIELGELEEPYFVRYLVDTP